jgi:hypothetical protein
LVNTDYIPSFGALPDGYQRAEIQPNPKFSFASFDFAPAYQAQNSTKLSIMITYEHTPSTA